MKENKKPTKLKDKPDEPSDQLNQVQFENASIENPEVSTPTNANSNQSNINAKLDAHFARVENEEKANKEYAEQIEKAHTALFDELDSKEFVPKDFTTKKRIDSLESEVGYSSLVRQLHDAFAEQIAYYRSEAGGSLPFDKAREKAFQRAPDHDQATKVFIKIMEYNLHDISFTDLHKLYGYAPRAAEYMWEMIKDEGRAEFESGHLSANTMFPVAYMKDAWNIARYLGIRESFMDEWNPRGGIEVALIDMLAQTFFQWQYWMEETVKRSQTKPRREHPEYERWKAENDITSKNVSWQDGYWFPPYVKEQEALDHAVQMADRFNRMFLRNLRQLRDLRRYSPVTINNPNQVNIASDGGQQINMSKSDQKAEIEKLEKP